MVTASGHLEGACLASSGLVEPHWHTITPKHLLFARIVSAQCLEGCVELQVTNSRYKDWPVHTTITGAGRGYGAGANPTCHSIPI